ncbi:MAG TPA: hypothetical protein VK668_07295 [Mucilaginibacter sp.]|nr:hypothetical protein [Mucilaginibacter sp.]
MRTGESLVKRCLVLSLLVMYLAIALTCVLYLPKYNPLRTVNHQSGGKTHLVLSQAHHTDHSTSNILVLLHRVYRSTIDNKQISVVGLSKAGLLLTFLVISSIIMAELLAKTNRRPQNVHHAHPYAYLAYCSLRI